jgi:hypothetical protein
MELGRHASVNHRWDLVANRDNEGMSPSRVCLRNQNLLPFDRWDHTFWLDRFLALKGLNPKLAPYGLAQPVWIQVAVALYCP